MAVFKKNGKTMPNKASVFTNIPNFPPIELVAYYDEFISYYPNCEMQVKSWFVRNIQEDWIIFDCGANIGYYSILFSKLAPKGRIFAFEPTSTYDMLLLNLTHNKANNVTSIKEALGKNTGIQEESIFRIWGKPGEKNVYPFTTIDDFIQKNTIKRIDCIKIDVDSFDFEVLQGATETLQKHDPYVIVELNHALNQRNQSVPQVLGWLSALGYKTIICIDYENFLLKRNYELSTEEQTWPNTTIFFEPTE